MSKQIIEFDNVIIDEKLELLWENPSPNSRFEAQTILNSDIVNQYSKFYIIIKSSYNDSSNNEYVGEINKNLTNAVSFLARETNSTSRVFSSFLIKNNELKNTIGIAQYSEKITEANSAYAIPLKIYGRK